MMLGQSAGEAKCAITYGGRDGENEWRELAP